MNLKDSYKLSIVIPCYTLDDELYKITKKCVERLRINTVLEHEIIIIENSNCPRLHELSPDVYVYLNDITSFTQKVNLGFRIAKNDWLVMVGNDVFVPRDWDIELMRVFEEKDDCGASTLLSSEFKEHPSDEIEEAYFGALWAINKKIFNEVGEMDESFKNSFGDADYWVRIYESGRKIYRNRKIMVEHLVQSTLKKVNNYNEIYKSNRDLFNEKHKDCGLEIFEALR